jgi:alpha-N-arabinofuranosidase
VLDKNGRKVTVNTLDILATQHSETEKISIAVVNKEPDKEKKLEICLDENSYARYEVQEYRIVGSSVDSYNDIDRTEVFIEQLPTKETSGVYQVNLAPHSINVIDFKIL